MDDRKNGFWDPFSLVDMFKCEHPHMILCNPIFDVGVDGIVVGTCEQGFEHTTLRRILEHGNVSI